MHEVKCGGEKHPGLCDAMDPYDGHQLLKHLLTVNFTGKCILIIKTWPHGKLFLAFQSKQPIFAMYSLGELKKCLT